MVQHWHPMKQVQPSPRRDEWFMFDGPRRIATIRRVQVEPYRYPVYRATTWAEREQDHDLFIGYFPELPWAAAWTWEEWVNAKKPRPTR